jgi:hypothetical protein
MVGPNSVVVVIVAAITVLALGFEPFVQQSLRSPLRNLEVTESPPTLQTTTNLVLTDADVASNASLIYNSVMLQGLFSDAMAPLQPLCAGTSCEWSSYYTAAVCSSCEDMLNDTTVTIAEEQAFHDFTTADYLDDFQGFDTISEIENREIVSRWNRSNNYTVSLGDSPPINVTVNLTAFLTLYGYFSQTLLFPEEVVFDASIRPPWESYGRNGVLVPNVTGPLSTLGYLQLDRSEDGIRLEIKAATRCAISLCAREQVSTVSNGSLDTQIKEETWGHYFQFSPNPFMGYNWTATLGENTFHVLDPLRTDVDATVLLIDNSINSLVGHSLRTQDHNPTYQSSILTDPAPNTKRFIAGDIRNSSARIAQAFTNYLQQNGDGQVSGKVYTAVAFVDVHWPWLIYPLAIVIVCFTMLIVTIFQTRRYKFPIWRTSPYPLLFAYQIGDASQVAMTNIAPAAVSAAARQDDDTGDGDAEEPSSAQRRATASKPFLTRSAAVDSDSISALQDVAKKTVVQLIRSDGRWVFEKPKSE